MDHIEIILKEDKTTYLNTSFGVKLDLLFSYYFESVGFSYLVEILLHFLLYLPSLLRHIAVIKQDHY